MTITGGSALPKDDIERMMRDAQDHADEDRSAARTRRPATWPSSCSGRPRSSWPRAATSCPRTQGQDQRGARRPAQRARRSGHRPDQVGAREAGQGLPGGRFAAVRAAAQRTAAQPARRAVRTAPRRRGVAPSRCRTAATRRRRRRWTPRSSTGRQEVSRKRTARTGRVSRASGRRVVDPDKRKIARRQPGGRRQQRRQAVPTPGTTRGRRGGRPAEPTPPRPEAGRRPPTEDAGAVPGSAPSWRRCAASSTSAPATCSG